MINDAQIVKHRMITKADHPFMLSLRERGKTNREIAEIMDCTYETVLHHIGKQGFNYGSPILREAKAARLAQSEGKNTENLLKACCQLLECAQKCVEEAKLLAK